ncbi:ABC transporter ATP-binding protein [Streptomyces sp. NPDC057580]|uniref:ABC transporter ATP-binding protein n=1 Tax=Streptomyces sp. NPDC057580 TaxID=3346173 RepID=UPI0036763364
MNGISRSGTGIPGAAGEPVLSVKDLKIDMVTDRGWVRVVDGVAYDVRPGETLGLVGESGSGKTLTSLAVMGLLPHGSSRLSGSVRLAGTELVGLRPKALQDLRGNRVSMVFQEPMTSLNPAFTVGDQISEGYRRHRRAGRKEGRARACEVLDMVGIPNAARRLDHYPHEFSGGMRQRVLIAMALVCEPSVLIADEPTTALDVTIQAQVLDLLRRMRDELGLALVIITHNMGVVADICDRVAVMYAGHVVEQGGVDQLFARPSHPYTEGLLRSMPQDSARSGRLHFIPGSPPEPWAMPGGCRFHPRCAYARQECEEGQPALVGDPHDRLTRCPFDELELKGTS